MPQELVPESLIVPELYTAPPCQTTTALALYVATNVIDPELFNVEP